jgi:Ca2+-binding RTX toxin-like protein
MRRVARAFLVAGFALFAMPAAAQATYTVSYASNTGLLIQGDAASDGAVLKLRAVGGGNRYRVAQLGTSTPETIPPATLVVGAGCLDVDEGTIQGVECSITGNPVITANLGDGADLLTASESTGVSDMFVDAGGGNDRVHGGTGSDSINGGAGNDVLAPFGGINVVEGGDGDDRITGDSADNGTNTLRGGAGDDTFQARQSETAPDLFEGGAGTDTADYSLRTAALHLSTTVGAADDPNDGVFMEGDDLDGVETIIGGSKNDLIVFSKPIRTAVLGIRTLMGGPGADELKVVGGLRASHDGGIGIDKIRGGASTDTIFSRDAEVDDILCGDGNDTLTADLKDVPLSDTCETIDQGAVKEGPNVQVLTRQVSVGQDGRLSVRLKCPRKLRRPCSGTLEARLDRRGSKFGPATRYSLRPGASITVEAELPAAQRGAARKQNARVRLRSVEKGTHGRKTTLRSLPVS